MKSDFVYPFFIPIIIFYGCKKPYNPPAIAAPNSYLVVEGVINSGSDSTTIKLSKTVNLSGDTISNAVTGATVTVEDNQNATYVLQDASPGNYVSGGLNLDNARQYRLRIKTPTDEYLSDYVPVLNSPPIDSVNFTVGGNGINIYASTHDPANNVKYYRWDYLETWIIHANYDSQFVSNGDTVLARTPSQQVWQCWRTDTSSNIILNSTARLSKSVIVNSPITSVASTSEKLASEYSILVRQYALTGDAYAFWTALKTSTEQLGSIFDAQPTQLNGNIHSVTNPSERVIGYVSVGSSATSRIFVHNAQLPYWQTIPTYSDEECLLDSVPFVGGTKSEVDYDEDLFFNYDTRNFAPIFFQIPVNVYRINSVIVGHTGSYPKCVDCTLRGTTTQPLYWK